MCARACPKSVPEGASGWLKSPAVPEAGRRGGGEGGEGGARHTGPQGPKPGGKSSPPRFSDKRAQGANPGSLTPSSQPRLRLAPTPGVSTVIADPSSRRVASVRGFPPQAGRTGRGESKAKEGGVRKLFPDPGAPPGVSFPTWLLLGKREVEACLNVGRKRCVCVGGGFWEFGRVSGKGRRARVRVTQSNQ